MLPPELEAFSRLPFWNALFLTLAVAVAVHSGWMLSRRRERQDLYYLLTGLYLIAIEAPIVFPDVPRSLGLEPPVPGSPVSIALALPAVALFILGLRSSREDGRGEDSGTTRTAAHSEAKSTSRPR